MVAGSGFWSARKPAVTQRDWPSTTSSARPSVTRPVTRTCLPEDSRPTWRAAWEELDHRLRSTVVHFFVCARLTARAVASWAATPSWKVRAAARSNERETGTRS